MRRIGILLILFLNLNSVYAEIISVGLFYGNQVSIIEILPLNADYTLKTDEEILPLFSENTIFQFVADDDSIVVYANDIKLRKCINVDIFNGGNCNFKIRSNDPVTNAEIYQGNFSLSSSYCFIKVINHIDLENYIAAVVKAEVGQNKPDEFYKSQSVICRTYALGHKRRHFLDGFQLCDKEHCQVYKGKCNIDKINKASIYTEDIILVDFQFNLILAAFHSNCGGQTANAEDVWNKPSFGLNSIKDTFCVMQRNAIWEREISKKQWVEYLNKKGKGKYIFSEEMNYAFFQSSRKIVYEKNGIKIPLKEIRTDFNLKSAFFSIVDNGEKLLLKGRGFGHGIGLCQEGAIRMAQMGYNMPDIMHHYYRGAILINSNKIDFFREE